ncbi:hypothetical protein SNEBB_004795 [Seison nebaliae]|nr:hypothetical protein SNEBB_004795 [Seison nebaliae]
MRYKTRHHLQILCVTSLLIVLIIFFDHWHKDSLGLTNVLELHCNAETGEYINSSTNRASCISHLSFPKKSERICQEVRSFDNVYITYDLQQLYPTNFFPDDSVPKNWHNKYLPRNLFSKIEFPYESPISCGNKCQWNGLDISPKIYDLLGKYPADIFSISIKTIIVTYRNRLDNFRKFLPIMVKFLEEHRKIDDFYSFKFSFMEQSFQSYAKSNSDFNYYQTNYNNNESEERSKVNSFNKASLYNTIFKEEMKEIIIHNICLIKSRYQRNIIEYREIIDEYLPASQKDFLFMNYSYPFDENLIERIFFHSDDSEICELFHNLNNPFKRLIIDNSCFILHDIDMLPLSLNEALFYKCNELNLLNEFKSIFLNELNSKKLEFYWKNKRNFSNDEQSSHYLNMELNRIQLRLKYAQIKKSVRHYSSYIYKSNFHDKRDLMNENLDFLESYNGLVGGVLALDSRILMLTNGFPNKFYGWGGEDDVLGFNLFMENICVFRPSSIISSNHTLSNVIWTNMQFYENGIKSSMAYYMMGHQSSSRNSNRVSMMFYSAAITNINDGLTHLHYKNIEIDQFPVATYRRVMLPKELNSKILKKIENIPIKDMNTIKKVDYNVFVKLYIFNRLFQFHDYFMNLENDNLLSIEETNILN